MPKLHKKCVQVQVTFPDGTVAVYPSIAEAGRNVGIARQEINRYLSGVYKTCRKGYQFEAI